MANHLIPSVMRAKLPRSSRPSTSIRYAALMLMVVASVANFAAAAESNPTKPSPELSGLTQPVPVPDDNSMTPAKIALGQQLFFDPRLSGDNTISCATCHQPAKAFADGLRRSRGTGGVVLKRNTPTVLNAAYAQRLFWDGRASSLEELALAPIVSPAEMNQDLDQLEDELAAVPGYAQQFRVIFGTGVTRAAIARSLAAFQRTLVARDSPFDRYLAGDETALSKSAQRGLELFTGDAQCIRCHHGPLLSDQKTYRLGISWLDRGVAEVTRQDKDLYRFRTPSLRNVAETAPYMHDGSVRTLDDVVFFYFRGVPTTTPDGKPLDIVPLTDNSFSDIADIVAFLRSLTGTFPSVETPKLPE